MSSIDTTLTERGSRYGDFETHAEHTQAIKQLLIKLMGETKWRALAADQKEALEMIAHKLGRITNGDPHYGDSWHDIAGYAQLVANRLAMPTPVHPFKVGDQVRIAEKIERYAGSPGWNRAMDGMLGKQGEVTNTDDAKGNYKVRVGVESWWFRAADLTRMPEAKDEAEAEAEAKDEAKAEECDCPACKLRKYLDATKVTIVLEEGDDSTTAESALQSLKEAIEKALGK